MTHDLTRITAVPKPPARPDDGHKGTFGTVLVVGGCDTMLGAPALAARAAFRAGAGLVKILAPQTILPHILTIESSATGVALTQASVPLDAADPSGRAVLAIGPGLGTSNDAIQRVLGLLDDPRPAVLDADALNLLAESGRTLTGASPRVLTPHPGEFRRLAAVAGIELDPTNPGTRPRAAAALARAHRAVVVLKGAGTVVSDGKVDYINNTGGPALATAGSGDVLTGLIAALISQGMSALDAAVLGVHRHGAAADAWSAANGGRSYGMLARELADAIVL